MSAHHLCKEIGPGSGLTKCQAWSGSNLIDTDGIPERSFRKSWFSKNQSMKNYPGDKELNWDYSYLRSNH